MIDRSLEARLAELYDGQIGPTVPAELRERILSIPDTRAWRGKPLEGRRTIILLAAALLIAALLAVASLGSGGFRGVGPLTATHRDPATIDVCEVLNAAFLRLGTRAATAAAARTFDHGDTPTAWGARICARGWDGSWDNPHLLLLSEPTTRIEADELLDVVFATEREGSAWVREAAGVWIAPAVDRSSGFTAVAVSSDPYFFVVTMGATSDATVLAEAVRLELLSTGD